jgi:hypothetical protein
MSLPRIAQFDLAGLLQLFALRLAQRDPHPAPDDLRVQIGVALARLAFRQRR